MSPDEHRFNALLLMFANLQRLMVFENSLALIEGSEPDPARVQELASRLDLVGRAIQRSSDTKSVSESDVAAVLPVAGYLADEVRAYYATEVERNPGARTAFAAAWVYLGTYLNDGTIHMGTVFGHPEWADRELQHKPGLISARNQANAAVAAAAKGEYPGQLLADTDHFAQLALADRRMALDQVDGLPVMLAGRDAREIPAT